MCGRIMAVSLYSSTDYNDKHDKSAFYFKCHRRPQIEKFPDAETNYFLFHN